MTVVRPPDVADLARRLLRSRRPAPLNTGRLDLPGRPTATPIAPTLGPPKNIGPPSGAGVMDGPGTPPWGADPSFDPANIQAQVSAQLDPILQYITQKYNAQAQGVSNAFGALTGQYANAMRGYAGQVPGLFAGSERIVQQAGQGLDSELAKLGGNLGKTQDKASAFVNLPSDAGGINLKKQGAGSGGAAGAIGQAMLDALRAEQSSAQKYASQLPGFAQLEGAANTRDVLSQLAGQLADQLAQTTAQAPQLYYQIYNDLQDRAQNDRSFALQVAEFGAQQQQYQDQRNAARAGITSPTAPTLAGRSAYWQSVAADRTKNTGYEWVGTTTGIRPVDADPTKPGIQRSYTLQGAAANRADITAGAKIANDKARTGIARTNANTAATRARIAQQQADTATQREANRHAEAVRRLNVAAQNATTAQQRAAIAKRAEAERERHNREAERISRMKKAAGGSGGSGSGTFNPATGNYG